MNYAHGWFKIKHFKIYSLIVNSTLIKIMHYFIDSEHGNPMTVPSVSLGVLPPTLLKYQHLFCLGCFLNCGENTGLLHVGAADASIILSADKKDILQLDLSADLEILKKLAHNAIVLGYLVLHALDADDSEYLLRVGRQRDPELRFMHIHDLVLLLFRLHGVLQAPLLDDLLALKRLLPLIHDPLVFLVDIVLVVHGLYTLLVKVPEELAEGGRSGLRKDRDLPEEGQRRLEELIALLELNEFKHIY